MKHSFKFTNQKIITNLSHEKIHETYQHESIKLKWVGCRMSINPFVRLSI